MGTEAGATSLATSTSPPAEKRQWVRHGCSPEVTCHLQANPPLDFWAVRVLNVSAGGVSLSLDRMVPTGKVLTVELRHAARGFACRRQARIVYTFHDPAGTFTVGAAFHPELTDRDLQALL